MNDRITSAVFSIRTKTWPAFFIGLVILGALWQLCLFEKTLKYDAIDITLPWRFFISDALHNGILPWWNPYQLHGFAQGTSPETWYPIAILLGWLRGYGLYSLNLEFLLHLFLAAWGFFRLSRAMGYSVRSSQYGALIFPLSGFFIGHAQHMGWIIAGTWIPHVLASFLYFGRDFNWSYGLSFVVSFFLLCCGGYPGLSIVTVYLIAFLGTWNLLIRKTTEFDGKAKLKHYLRLTLLTVFTCAIVIACFINLKSALWRGRGLEGHDSLVGSFYFKHLISLIFPFSTVKGSFEVWNADQSVMNIYLGLPVLFIISLGFKSIKQHRRFLLLALISLLLSLGAELPFRSWANALPLWDLFRFPALFRYFFSLAIILLMVQILDQHHDDLKILRVHLARLSLIVAVLSGLLFAYWAIAHPSLVKMVLNLSVTSILAAIIFQTLSICLLTGLATLLLQRKNLGFWPVMFLVAALDLGIMVQTNGRVSVFSEQNLAPMQACLEELPSGYPTPSLLDPIGSNEDRTLNFGSIYRNTSMLFKQPSWDGYSPFQYNGYVQFNNGPYYENALQQPFAFLSKLNPIMEGEKHYNSSSLLYTKENKLDILGFQPNSIRFLADLAYPRILVLNQNYEDHWKAQIDGKDLSVVKTDENLLSIVLPAGKNELHIFYENSSLSNALWISAILFCTLVFILMLINLPIISWIALVVSLILFAIIGGRSIRNDDEIQESIKGHQIELTIQNNIDEDQSTDSNTIKDRFLDWRDFPRFRELVRNQRSPFLYESRSPCNREDFFLDFLHRSTHFDSTRTLDDGGVVCYPSRYQSFIISSFNGFEGYASGWKKVEQGNTLDKSGNRFQKLVGDKFSSIWDGPISLTNKQYLNLNISVETRGENVVDVGLVYALQAGDEVVHYQSHLLKQQQDSIKWSKTRWNSSLEVDAGDYNLRVYLWNPALRSLDLDNFSIEVERQ